MLVYWVSLPDHSISGQWVGQTLNQDGTFELTLRLGQSGSKLFGDCRLKARGGTVESSRLAHLKGTVRRNHFTLRGRFQAEPILIEGERSLNWDNNMPQLVGTFRFEQKRSQGRFLVRHSSSWCPDTVLLLEK